MVPALAVNFYSDCPVIHHELAKTCLQYIGFQDFSTPIKDEASSAFAATSSQPGVAFPLNFLDTNWY
jgi:hypothetical protein